MRHAPSPVLSTARPPRPDVRPSTEALRTLGAFPSATDRDIRTIVEAGRTVTVPKDWSVIIERTPADKAYVVLSGTASVRHDNKEFARIGPGGVIGEMAIIEHKLRNATVVATTPLEALHFTREAVERLREECPAFREALEAAFLSHVA